MSNKLTFDLHFGAQNKCASAISWYCLYRRCKTHIFFGCAHHNIHCYIATQVRYDPKSDVGCNWFHCPLQFLLYMFPLLQHFLMPYFLLITACNFVTIFATLKASVLFSYIFCALVDSFSHSKQCFRYSLLLLWVLHN